MGLCRRIHVYCVTSLYRYKCRERVVLLWNDKWYRAPLSFAWWLGIDWANHDGSRGWGMGSECVISRFRSIIEAAVLTDNGVRARRGSAGVAQGRSTTAGVVFIVASLLPHLLRFDTVSRLDIAVRFAIVLCSQDGVQDFWLFWCRFGGSTWRVVRVGESRFFFFWRTSSHFCRVVRTTVGVAPATKQKKSDGGRRCCCKDEAGNSDNDEYPYWHHRSLLPDITPVAGQTKSGLDEDDYSQIPSSSFTAFKYRRGKKKVHQQGHSCTQMAYYRVS